jgi:hypothetical protein
MSNRPALIKKGDAVRLFKAARESGYRRARVIAHPDGRVEVIAEDLPDERDGSEWDEVLH